MSPQGSVYYGIANFAALRMPRAGKLYSDAVPVVDVIACAVLALSLTLTLPVIVTGSVVLAVGLLLRLAVRRERR